MCHSCCRSGVEAEVEKAVLQGEVQAALDQKDAALGQRDAALGQKDAALGQRDAALEEQASLQELLASTERRAAAAELGSFANEHTKQASTQIKVRLIAGVVTLFYPCLLSCFHTACLTASMLLVVNCGAFLSILM